MVVNLLHSYSVKFLTPTHYSEVDYPRLNPYICNETKEPHLTIEGHLISTYLVAISTIPLQNC